jgi:hypothetical protein
VVSGPCEYSANRDSARTLLARGIAAQSGVFLLVVVSTRQNRS